MVTTREYQFIVGPETSALPTIGTPTNPEDIMSKGYADDTYTAKAHHYGSVQTAANAREIVSGDYFDKQTLWVDTITKFFYFDTASMAVDDGSTVLKPDDILIGNPGRWLQVPASGVPTPPVDFMLDGGVTLFTDVDCLVRYHAAASITKISLGMVNSGITGSTIITVYRNRYGGGVSGSTSQTASVTANGGANTALVTLGSPITMVDGDYITLDVTTVPTTGAPESLRVRLIHA